MLHKKSVYLIPAAILIMVALYFSAQPIMSTLEMIDYSNIKEVK